MRYLHPVGVKEKFVASGVYEQVRVFPVETPEAADDIAEAMAIPRESIILRQLDDNPPRYSIEVPADGRLEWSLHELPDGSMIARSHRDDRLEIIGEALVDPAGRIDRFDAKAYERGTLLTEVSYVFFERHVQVGRRDAAQNPDTEREHEELEYPRGCLVDTGDFITRGAALRGAAGAGQPGGKGWPLFCILPFTDDDDVLQGMLRYIRVEQIGAESFTIGKQSLHATVLEVTESDHADMAFRWPVYVDDHSMVLEDGIFARWKLTQYARRPDPKRA